MTWLKRDAMNRIPMDHSLPNVLGQPAVAFHLLPLAGAGSKGSFHKREADHVVQFANPELEPKEEPKERKESNETATKPWKFHVCAEPGCFKPHSLQEHR